MKECLFCKKQICKKEYENDRDFKRRLYCNQNCFNLHRLQKRKEKLIGNKTGKMTVCNIINQNGIEYVILNCECGNQKKYKYSSYKVSPPTHCGCNNRNKTHGMTNSPLYKSWVAMRRRCDNPDNYHKKYYKDKGITYIEEWKSFDIFSNWALKNGYIEGYTIERIDNSKGYYPQNCTWIPKQEQQKNRTSNHFVEIDGKIKTISQWCNEYNIKWTTFYTRLKKGKKDKDLLKGE